MIDGAPGAGSLILTKQYRRFVEFCDACKRNQYIGLCYGAPGVGKSVSAEHYARWSVFAPYVDVEHPIKPRDIFEPPAEAIDCDTLLYTPRVHNHPNQIFKHIDSMRFQVAQVRHYAGFVARGEPIPTRYTNHHLNRFQSKTKLIIVDEADRLKLLSLEQFRDTFDRDNVALIFVGMPGIEKRMARYPQLYSRVGFVHEFKPLSEEEVRFTLDRKWQHLGVATASDDFTDAEAIAAVVRITAGNFRLLRRLLSQVARILEINGIKTVTREVVEAARDSLIIGTAA